MASASSGIAYVYVRQLPIVPCPECGKRVIRLQSKKSETYGQYFFKCEDNDQNSGSCVFYKWEDKYRRWLQANLVDDGGRRIGTDDTFALAPKPNEGKLELLELKHEIRQLTERINELRLEVVSLHTKPSLVKTGVVVESVCVVSVLVGCILGILVAILCK